MNTEVYTPFTDPGYSAPNASSVSTTNTVNTNALGTYTVTYVAKDAQGIAVATGTRTVYVVDTTAPVITFSPSTVTITQGNIFDPSAGVTITDNYRQENDIGFSIANNPVDTNTVGTYEVGYMAHD
jgi:hypothetical protein